MFELAGLPLKLVSLWIVPMLLASHVYLLRTSARHEELDEIKSAAA